MARRRWKRFLLTLSVLLVGVPGLYALAAFGLACIPVNQSFVEPQEGQGIEIQLASNGIHVDFLLPAVTRVMDWSRRFPRSSFPDVGEERTYILVGWGNRRFFIETPTWTDLKVSTALGAIFWPSASVVHVEYLLRPFKETASCRSIRITEAAYLELCHFVEESFQRDADGGFKLLPGKSYGPNDNFYEGTGSYHALNTCNSWTVRGLKRMGVRTALWSPFPHGICWNLPDRR
jgi:uncharacterized protein (TIGR02117 family)